MKCLVSSVFQFGLRGFGIPFVGCYDGQVVAFRLEGIRVQPRRWVGRSVDLLQHTNGDVSVYFCGVEPYMAEHRLNVTDVSAAFEH
jgi:hypothetical protein